MGNQMLKKQLTAGPNMLPRRHEDFEDTDQKHATPWTRIGFQIEDSKQG